MSKENRRRHAGGKEQDMSDTPITDMTEKACKNLFDPFNAVLASMRVMETDWKKTQDDLMVAQDTIRQQENYIAAIKKAYSGGVGE